MRSAGVAIAWEFGRRHRWGFAALVGYLLLLGTTDILILAPGQEVGWDGSPDLPPRFVATVLVPVYMLSFYLLAAFSFGLSGDLTARASGYPARVFTLPVSTAALAGWPMFYGTTTIAGLLLATTRFVVWPSGVDVPLVWPALFGAAMLAWTQVLMWMPFGLPGLRVAIGVVLLATPSAVVLLAIEGDVPASVMTAAMAPQVPLAFLAARFAVGLARRGVVPDWRVTSGAPGRITDLLSRRQRRFRSAAQAQRWFEWRQTGRSLPVWVGILLPFELVLLFVAGPHSPALIAYTLAGALLTPPFMAAFAAPAVRRSDPRSSVGHAMAPFTAARPMTGAALVAAKLGTAARSTLTAWLLVLVAIPAALTLSDTWPVVQHRVSRVSDAIGTPRTVAVVLLGLAGLVTWTWKQLVQSLYVGLSGREWLIRAATALTLTVLIFIEPIVQWVRESDDAQIALWNALPWAIAGLALTKTVAAGWIATRLHRHRLLTDRALVTAAAAWLTAVLALYGLLGWLVSGPLVPRHILILLAILAVPLARLSAAPLALASNRHR